MKKISIITPVFCPNLKVLETLKKCMKSVRKAVDKVNGEYIIVDDFTDVGSSFFKEISDSYIKNSKLSGVATSLNKGLKINESKFCVKLDSDYLVPENLFEILLNDWTDNLGFITPSYVIGNSKKKEHFLNLPKSTGGIKDNPNGTTKYFTEEVSWGGGIFLFSREAAKKINYFDENFGFSRGEDNDFIFRMLLNGYDWRWSNNVVTRHFASISGKEKNSKIDINKRNQINYFEKKHGFPAGGFINVAMQRLKNA
jgi:GT2 family glycosyltransferase